MTNDIITKKDIKLFEEIQSGHNELKSILKVIKNFIIQKRKTNEQQYNLTLQKLKKDISEFETQINSSQLKV